MVVVNYTYDDETLGFKQIWTLFVRKEIYCLFKKGPAPCCLMSGGGKG
jgi:hypothetical protein